MKNNFMSPYIKNKKINFLVLAAVFIFFLSLSALAGQALAQTGTGELRLTTSPLPINLKVAPGSSVSANLKIKNDGNQSEDLKVTLMKFKADPNTGAAILADREPADSYFDWVTFSDPFRPGFSEASPTFTLPSNEWKTITANFNVPADASFDYYYAIVFFRANQQVKPGDRQTVLNGGTATLVLLTADVPGAKKQLELDQFIVNKNIFEFLPATFNIKIKNTGDVHIIPHGNIFISKGGQKNVAILDVNSTQGSILPDSPRNFQTEWADGFPVYTIKEENGVRQKDDKGNLIYQLKWDFKDASKLRWGKYTAKLLLVYDDGKRDIPIEGEVSFWVVPWRVIGGDLLILIFVLIGLKSTLQSWYKKIRNLLAEKK